MEEIDIFCCYADGRMDYEEDWITPTNQETSKGMGYYSQPTNLRRVGNTYIDK